MPDLVIDQNNIRQLATQPWTQFAEGAVVAGEIVYRNDQTGKWKVDPGAATILPTTTVLGFALTTADADQRFQVIPMGLINVGATAVASEVYVSSANAGKIAPVGDLITGQYTRILGTGLGGNMNFKTLISDQPKP